MCGQFTVEGIFGGRMISPQFDGMNIDLRDARDLINNLVAIGTPCRKAASWGECKGGCPRCHDVCAVWACIALYSRKSITRKSRFDDIIVSS